MRGQSAQAVAGVATSGDGIAQSYGALGPANSYTGSQDLGAMAAGLFPSDPELLEAPIGIRTRARHPLAGVTIEQLGALDLPEEDILPLSDEEYYQHFLEVGDVAPLWIAGQFLHAWSWPGVVIWACCLCRTWN